MGQQTSDKHLYRMRNYWRLGDCYEVAVKSEAQDLPFHQLQDLLKGHVCYQFYIILQMFDMPTDKKKIQNKSACETNGNHRWEPT